jgi:uncharacterized protein YsxB (DUF464 family)
LIAITLRRSPTGFIRGFVVDGHAGYRKAGEDIICAAVSVLAYTAVGALKDLAGLSPDWSEQDGHMDCQVPDPEEMPHGRLETTRTILDSFALGCRQVEASYGGKYVRVTDEPFEEKEVSKR